MSEKRNVSVCRGHELANALYLLCSRQRLHELMNTADVGHNLIVLMEQFEVELLSRFFSIIQWEKNPFITKNLLVKRHISYLHKATGLL